jgi:beta-lactamase regulating signal transducer with metallopeptidase domain
MAVAAEPKTMREQLTHAIYYTEVHLIYTSLVWLAAWVLTSSARVSATAKHWIWLVTALNFAVPLGAIADGLFAPHITWARPLGAVGGVGVAISENLPLAATLGAVWSIGAAIMLARLCARIAIGHRSVKATSPSHSVTSHSFRTGGVAITFGDPRLAPAVNGIWRSYISLPRGIDELLSERELKSVLIHELAHARRHDNLICLVYEIALCALWFHPLLWITGSRLALYRELSCDESVVEHGHGQDLLAALAKLANIDEKLLLQASATSFFQHRLARLTSTGGTRISTLGSALVAMCFSFVFLAGVLLTVAHTACCFVPRV